VPRFRQAGLRQLPLIDANYPGGAAAMKRMWATAASREAFVDAALAKLKQQGYAGCHAPQRKFCRVGPNCETWPNTLTENSLLKRILKPCAIFVHPLARRNTPMDRAVVGMHASIAEFD
jgi:hypothetical protein